MFFASFSDVLYFQTCFIIGPNGDVILRYRRLSSSFEATPHDVWSKYLDLYGLEGVFPVAKTEIGNLGSDGFTSDQSFAVCGLPNGLAASAL